MALSWVSLIAVLCAACVSAAAQEMYDLPRKTVRYVIIGGGPGGLQMAYFMQKAGLDYVVLEKGDNSGHFFETYPRHRMMISANKANTGSTDREFGLRHDWNSLLQDGEENPIFLSNYTKDFFPQADVYVQYLKDFEAKYKLNVIKCSAASQIVQDGGNYVVRVSDSCKNATKPHIEYYTGVLIVATGYIPMKPQFPGSEYMEQYETFDPSLVHEKYTNKRVLIIGLGNSAFEVANNVSNVAHYVHMCSPSGSPKFSWHTHYPGHLRSVNAAFLDTYQLKMQNLIRGCVVSGLTRILKLPDGTLEFMTSSNVPTNADRRLNYDYIINTMGFRWEQEIFDPMIRVPYNDEDRLPDLTAFWASISQSNIFFAGTLMAGRSKTRAAIPFVHGFRYAIRTQFEHIMQTFEKRPPTAIRLPHTPEALATQIINRVQRSGGLFQLFNGYLVDVAWFDKAAREWVYEQEVPSDDVFTSELYADRAFFVVSLEFHPEFGKSKALFNTFGMDRVSNHLAPDTGYLGKFLHPIVRYFVAKDNRRERKGFQSDPVVPFSPEAPDWQGFKNKPTATATFHFMESPLIDFQDDVFHVEPLTRYLVGVLYSRPELLPPGVEPPMDRVKPLPRPQTAVEYVTQTGPEVVERELQKQMEEYPMSNEELSRHYDQLRRIFHQHKVGPYGEKDEL